MKYLKKYWFILVVLLISLIRFILSFKLPSFYLINLKYDDNLVKMMYESIIDGRYLGGYSLFTLIKGNIYSFVLYYASLLKMSYSSFLTILYILSNLYLLSSLRNIIKNKYFLLFIYIVLLFNPVTYSGELFQRLYINSISIIELILFVATMINIVATKEEDYINYVILGTISGLMILTRNDNIWIYIVIVLLAIYKLKEKFSYKRLIGVSIPLGVILLLLNIVSFVNYKYYGIYTYSEVENSYFTEAYNKVLQIKDDERISKVAIPRSTFYKLAEVSDVFEYTKEEIDRSYTKALRGPGEEIDNGDIMWFFRSILYKKYDFKDGKEANEYFYELSKDIDRLFKEGKLEKEVSVPIVYINMPTKKEILELPGSLVKVIGYTSSYKNVKTYSKKDLLKLDNSNYDDNYKAYVVYYNDYRYAEKMIDHNPLGYEIIRVIYKYFTIIFSFISLFIYIKNIKKKDNLNMIIHIILLVYIIVLCGVVYTNVTAFFAIRYRYLANVYILQSLFILLNMNRLIKKTGDEDDISSNTCL